MSDDHSFLEELKRRKVARSAVVYLAVAWAAVQVADVFVPALGFPESIVTTVAVLVIVGFPVTLVLTWLFDVTPRGVERTSASSADPPSAAAATGWVGPGTVTVAALLVAVGFLVTRAFEFVDEQGQALNRFAGYELYPDGPPELWVARMYWALGDAARASVLSGGLADEYAAQTPAVQGGAGGTPGAVDVFGVRASYHLVRAWELAFDGRAEEAQAEADLAVALHGYERDKTDGGLFQRQRPLIRIVTGDLDGAVEDLRFLLSVPSRTTKWELRLDPIYDPLRGRADFEALIAD